MKRKIILAFLVFHAFYQISLSYEGMWIPLLIEKLNIKDMQEKGFRLTAEDIYSVNQACLANAIVLFGRGCTGEVISPEGLVLTNHHCGFSRIQSHSSLQNDYLTHGFWAYSKADELPNPGLTVSFLVWMEDVTDKIISVNDTALKIQMKEAKITERIKNHISKTIAGTHYEAEIKPFFFGKEYYMFVYETFRDVRMVGAPPTSIGKFGGDTDNWIWPRHTGDFSIFRIYADSANNPADYSPANIPYKPKKYLKLSIKEIKEGDFTMILGYPANTNEYLTSHEIMMITEKLLPKKIELREAKLDIMQSAMLNSDEIRLKYASKYAGVSNAWKKWIGVVDGAKRFNTVAKKEEFESQFVSWLISNPLMEKKYGTLLPEFEKIYLQYEPYYFASDYGYEAIFGAELTEFISHFTRLINLNPYSDKTVLSSTLTDLKSKTGSFFKNYSASIDEQVYVKMLELYYHNVNPVFHPEFYKTIQGKFKGNHEEFVHQVFKKTMFTNREKVMDLLNTYHYSDAKKIISDPAFNIYNSFAIIYGSIVFPQYQTLHAQLQSLYPDYLEAMMLMQPEKQFYPDANFTMRMTYGKVEGYSPADAIQYRYYSTLSGVMEKEHPEIYDYFVPDKLKLLYQSKDFGRYGINGTMPVCFVASNHTSGGNSGSPVFNADGELIGINFDRNWEGTINDYMYDPDRCRNISLDIRYVLFIIEKYAGAYNIINELTIIE